jgi:PiT family inorganic phosphate transporter
LAIDAPAPPTDSAPAITRNDTWLHLFFGLLLVASAVTFTLWSIGWMGDGASRSVLIVAIVFGLFMAFNIGGNDVANSFGTSVGAGTLTMKQALLIAAVFELAVAVLAGGRVTETVRSGIVDLDALAGDATHLAFVMMAALLGAGIWLLLATRFGLPVSTTHAIIGGIVGAAVTMGIATGAGGPGMVQWGGIGTIAISWVVSPLCGGVLAFVIYWIIKRRILGYNERADEAIEALRTERDEHRTKHEARRGRLTEMQQESYRLSMEQDAALVRSGTYDPAALSTEYYRELHEIAAKEREVRPHRALELWGPILAGGGAMIIAGMLVLKGLGNLDLPIGAAAQVAIVLVIGAAAWLTVRVFTTKLRAQTLPRATFVLFAWMQVFTASAFAFSHGSNDISNAVGPFAAVLDTLRGGAVTAQGAVPTPVMVAFGIALLSGLWFIGRRVITTVGEKLTKIHPASGFAAELAAAAVVMLATFSGLPVSSTHTLIGAILGIGLVNRTANWQLMKPIGLAWIVTLPATALMGAVGYVAISAIF